VGVLIVELLSLFTALCYGASAVLARKGMKTSNPLTGAIVGSLVQVVILTVILIFNIPETVNWTAVAYFVASGLLASTLGRLFNYSAIESLGVSMASAIIGSSPLFSTLFAIVFIGEEVAVSTLIGSLFVVGGIGIIRGLEKSGSGIKSKAILIPIGASVFYGASSVVRKVGLNLQPDSAFGALIGAGSSLVSFAVYLVATGKIEEIRLDDESKKYFVASGVVVSLAWLSMFTALAGGKVSVVSALIGANPLFSILLSLMFLKDSEELDAKIIAGCLAIVAGVAIITLL